MLALSLSVGTATATAQGPVDPHEACYTEPTQECLIDLAVDNATAIDWFETRSNALQAIAEAQIELGDLTGAMATAINMEWSHERPAILRSLADLFRENGDLALAQVAELRASHADHQGLFDIPREDIRTHDEAVIQLRLGRLESALSVAAGISHPLSRESALGMLARAYADRGDIQGVLTVSELSNDYWQRAFTLGRLAELHAELGNSADALATLDLALDTGLLDKDEYGTVMALVAFGLTYVESGDMRTALRLVDMTNDWVREEVEPNEQGTYYDRIDRFFRAVDELGEGNLETADLHEAASDHLVRTRLEALRGLASSQLLQGDQDTAVETLNIAAEIALDLTRFRDIELQMIGVDQVTAGDIDGALATAAQITRAERRSAVLATAAIELARSGNLSDALVEAQNITDPASAAEALLDIAMLTDWTEATDGELAK